MYDIIRSEVREECRKRDNYLCVNPKCKVANEVKVLNNGKKVWKNKRWSTVYGVWIQNVHLHHCIFRSRYFGEDRDEPWNLASLCKMCHNNLHNFDIELENMFIHIALERRAAAGMPAIDYSNIDIKDKKKKTNAYKEKYKRDKEKFMETHDGLTPLQYNYRRKKSLNS